MLRVLGTRRKVAVVCDTLEPIGNLMHLVSIRAALKRWPESHQNGGFYFGRGFCRVVWDQPTNHM